MASNKIEEKVIVDLLNKKTNSTNYSTTDNIVITVDEIIKHILDPQDPFWINAIKRFIDNLTREIPDLKEIEKYLKLERYLTIEKINEYKKYILNL